MEVALVCAVVGVSVLGVASLLGGLASSVANGHWTTWRAVAWLIVGIVGFPVFLLAAVYLVGLAAALVIFWYSAALARWRTTAQLTAGSCAAVAGVFFALEIPVWQQAVAFGVSAACAVLAVAKLGRTFRQDTIWESRFTQDAA